MNIAELVLKAKQSDNEAKSELCKQTYNLAYFHAIKLVKNENDALDLVQDSYVKAINNLDMLDNPERFTSWLTSIILNKCKDYLKKKKPTLFVEMQNDNFDSDFDIEDDKTEFQPEAQVDYSETKAIIGDMIDSLPDDQRACVIMYYFEEMSILEIASTMNLSENTIKSKLFYARKKIKTQVLDMEKQYGVKLYSVAPIPFIIWVLRQQAANAVVPQEAAAQIIGAATSGSKVTVAAVEAATEIATEAGATAAAEAGATATATNAGTAVTSVASKIASVVTTNIAKIGSVKLVAGIAAGVVALTGIGVAVYQSNKKPDEAAIQRAMTILINDPMFLENSARSMWGNYSGTGDYQSKSGYEAFMDKYGESDFAEQVGRTLYPGEANAAQALSAESSSASESSLSSEAETSKAEEPTPQEDTFAMSIYGHEVRFPSSYQGKIQIKEGVDSQGDSYASVYYKPLYDRAQQGEKFDKLRNGEILYTDLWTRSYYDAHIRSWYDKCIAQGSFTDPIPDQRAISFKPDTILVSMQFTGAPTNTEQSDPDIAEFAKLLEIVKESCTQEQAKNLPLDQPNYDSYLKAWWEGLGITTGETFTQNILGYNIKLPQKMKDSLIFEQGQSPVDGPQVIMYYKPVYDNLSPSDTNGKLNCTMFAFHVMPRSEYDSEFARWDYYMKENNNRANFGPFAPSSAPIASTTNGDVLIVSVATGVFSVNQNGLKGQEIDAICSELYVVFDNMQQQTLLSDQSNCEKYVKANPEYFKFDFNEKI